MSRTDVLNGVKRVVAYDFASGPCQIPRCAFPVAPRTNAFTRLPFPMPGRANDKKPDQQHPQKPIHILPLVGMSHMNWAETRSNAGRHSVREYHLGR